VIFDLETLQPIYYSIAFIGSLWHFATL